MERWEGLGAKGDGRKSHIATVKNGPDGVGYGKERHKSRDELWWANVYEKNDGKKKRKRKRSISLRRNENKTYSKTRIHRMTCQQKSKS